ncbi:MAG: NTP transferase domain-containing protein [Bacteroidales bacterium]|nr:NTP transferase domain-containing protein [Bacteroidales bacterium]
MIPISALIAAAGYSSRMATGKALLPFDDNTTFAGHLISSYYDNGCEPVILVVNPFLDISKLKTGNFIPVINKNPEKGRNWSIHLGICLVPPGFSCFINNVDNPYITADLIRKMVRELSPDSFVIPVFQDHGGHPVLLGSNMVTYIRDRKEVVDFRETLKMFNRVEVPCADGQVLWNINTPEDYRKFRAKF